MRLLCQTRVQVILLFLAPILMGTSGCVGIAKSSPSASVTSMSISPVVATTAPGTKTQFTAAILGGSANTAPATGWRWQG